MHFNKRCDVTRRSLEGVTMLKRPDFSLVNDSSRLASVFPGQDQIRSILQNIRPKRQVAVISLVSWRSNYKIMVDEK